MAQPQSPHPNLLLVEGIDDLHCVIHLMRKYVQWPDAGSELSRPFEVEQFGGIDKLTRAFLSTRWKAEGRRAIGVVVDADDDPNARFSAVRGLAEPLIPELPRAPAGDGLVHVAEDTRRLGIWVMPDNTGKGLLETFLAYCVRPHHETLWDHAKKVLDTVLPLQPPDKRPAPEKAAIHTFLAWHEPPGNPPGTAIKAGVLDTGGALAARFADWCIRLFGLDAIRLPRAEGNPTTASQTGGTPLPRVD